MGEERGKVAVVGAGPAGMHAALLLARQGFAVEVFEKEKKAGGMLRYYLPEFRFSRKGIREKEKQLEKEGVKMHLGKGIGKEMPLQGLAERFEAVVLACGEWKPRKLGIKGEGLKGVKYWAGFLRAFNEGKEKGMKGKKAIVIGGGNTAIDCARAAKRLGAAVAIAYRRSREGMPAHENEKKTAEKEGMEIKTHLSPKRFKGSKKLEAVVFEKTQGRGREMKMTEEEQEIKADAAIIAAGRQPDLSVLEGSKWNGFGELPEKVVRAGDLATKEKTIKAAIESAGHAVEEIKQITDN